MGKKREKRLSIGQQVYFPKKDNKNDKSQPSDCSLVLSFRERKKIVANFQYDRVNIKSEPEKRNYIEFNYDGLKYSPTFVYEGQLKHVDRLKENYLNKLKDAKETDLQIGPIRAPQPRQKKNRQTFCGVCKKHFEKYFDHIKASEHIEKMQEGKFTHNLKKIENFYTSKKQRRARQKKKLGPLRKIQTVLT